MMYLLTMGWKRQVNLSLIVCTFPAYAAIVGDGTCADWTIERERENFTSPFRELSEMPWVHRWWNQVIGFMHRLSNMPEDSIHAEILRDTIADAQEHPSYGNWAGGIVKQYSRLGMVSPFSSSGIRKGGRKVYNTPGSQLG